MMNNKILNNDLYKICGRRKKDIAFCQGMLAANTATQMSHTKTTLQMSHTDTKHKYTNKQNSQYRF